MAKNVSATKPLFGNKRSHSLRATRHAQKPNLQKRTLDNGLSVRMSAREWKAFNKLNNKAVEEDITA